MLARLRSTTIGLLGLVTAVGLGLVAFISQLGFPGAFNGAIPDGPGGSAAVHGAIALTPAVGTAHPAGGGRISSARVRLPSSVSSHAPRSAAGPHLDSLNQAGHVPSTGQPPAHPPSPSTPPTEPVGEPAPATEAPAPSAASPKSEPPAQPEKSSSKSQSRDHSGAKAKDHAEEKTKGQADVKPVASSTGGSKNHHSAAKGKRHSGVPLKPTGNSPGNSGESSASPAKGSSPPPSAGPGEKVPPEAEGKETGDAGKNGGKSHH